jgi:hypothetical protein
MAVNMKSNMVPISHLQRHSTQAGLKWRTCLEELLL